MANLIVSFGSKIAAFSTKHPVVRGMASYGLLWPTSCLIKQSIEGKRWDTYDWAQCGRYCLYGSLFTAPTLYLWVRISTKIWPRTNFKTALLKAVVEQMTYGPAAMVCFFIGMSFLEGKSLEQAKEEVRAKFWPTYKVAICFWPVFQTFNFALVPERNRVMFVSCCSLLWVIFLAYMKSLDPEELIKKNKHIIHIVD